MNNNFLPEIVVTPTQKARFIKYFGCEDLYASYITHIRKLLFMQAQHEKESHIKPFELLNEFGRISATTRKLSKQISDAGTAIDLFDQVFRLMQLEDAGEEISSFRKKISIDDMLSLLSVLGKAADEMKQEIHAKNAKASIPRVTVAEILRFVKSHKLPCGKRSSKFQDLLSVTFEVMKIDHERDFESLIDKIGKTICRGG